VVLELDDIDWRAGEIEVHGKGRRHDRLPLPTDVGEALAAYLKRVGPPATVDESSSVITLPSVGSPKPVRSAAFLIAHARGQASPMYRLTVFDTRWRPRCCAPGPRSPTSGRSFVTLASPRRLYTPKSITNG